MKAPRERLDFSAYLRAVGVFARNPTVVVLPLLAGVIGVLIEQISDLAGPGLLGSVTSFLLLLLQLFALGVSIIIADAGWRRGTASFDDAWQDARHKSRDILFAAFGFTFVLSIAQYASQIVGAFGVVLMALAAYGLIYTIAAAAIGGIPGGAAINVSLERVRSAPFTAAILAVVSLVFFLYLGPSADALIFNAGGIGSPIVALLLGALVRAILTGYVAIVMAKVYADVSFTPPRW